MFNVVVGRGAEVGTPLVCDPRVARVSFTGSMAVGELVRNEAMALGKRVQLELGGHSPLVVMDDADLDPRERSRVCRCVLVGRAEMHRYAPHLCPRRVYDAFKSRLLARIERGVVGDPTDPATEVGPLVSDQQMERRARRRRPRPAKRAARCCSAASGSATTGIMLTPALFEDVDDDGFLSREEVFGPVASLYRFADLDEAIERSNGTRYGLSASIFTRDTDAVQRFVNGIEAGVIRVNAATAGGEPHVPFGGTKGSGYGPREQGRAALDFYTETTTVYQNP